MEEKNKLIEQYIPLAKSAARNKFLKYKTIPFDEILSAAFFGLVDAANKFKEEKGVFPSYARERIFGEIASLARERFSRKFSYIEDGDLVSSLSFDDVFNGFFECLEDETQKVVFRLYFLERKSLKSIGEKIGVCESRVSQILKASKEKVRNSF